MRAAQSTKSLGRRLRSKRRERGSQGSGFSPFLRAGTGHPPRWFSVSLQEVVAAHGGLLGCWGDSGASLGVWESLRCFQKEALASEEDSGPAKPLLWWLRWLRHSGPKRGSRRLGGYLGSVWEETEVGSTECGGSYECLKISEKKGPKVFVVECRECGWSRGVKLGGLRR